MSKASRKLVADTFKRFVIYHHGVDPDDDSGPHIDVLLISKTGNARSLRIHRRTGAVISADDVAEN